MESCFGDVTSNQNGFHLEFEQFCVRNKVKIIKKKKEKLHSVWTVLCPDVDADQKRSSPRLELIFVTKIFLSP